MVIPTEPIGSIPRPQNLLDGIAAVGDGTHESLDPLYDEAVRDTVSKFEDTGSPVITDGEQRDGASVRPDCRARQPDLAPRPERNRDRN